MHVAIRSLFGVGEAGNFPASIKTVAEWFPKRERALATGIFNSGSNLGAMIAALFVPWCMVIFGDQLGWKMAFVITGSLGFLWLIFWFWLYEPPSKQKRLSKEEYDYIHIDEEVNVIGTKEQEEAKAKVPWLKLFSYRQTWAVFFGKFMTDGIWWFDNTSIGLFTKFGFDISRTIHCYEAILATLAIVVWHFYFVIFNPDVYPMNLAWLTGRMSEEEMAEEHPVELARLKALQAKADDEVPPATPPH